METMSSPRCNEYVCLDKKSQYNNEFSLRAVNLSETVPWGERELTGVRQTANGEQHHLADAVVTTVFLQVVVEDVKYAEVKSLFLYAFCEKKKSIRHTNQITLRVYANY